MKLPRSCTNMIIACSTRADECVSYEDIKQHIWPAEAPKSWRMILSRCAKIIRSHHGAASLRNVYGKGYVWGMLPELSSVVLVRDVPPRRKGDRGVIVHVFPQAKAYILEFEADDENGERLLDCKPSDVEAA